MLHGVPPSYDQLRVFGCLCYAHRRACDKDKFGDQSRKCLFVGYPYGKKAWKLYDIERDEFFSSRDVVFLEDEFSGLSTVEHVAPPNFQPTISIDEWLFPVVPSSVIPPTISPTTPVASITELLSSPTSPTAVSNPPLQLPTVAPSTVFPLPNSAAVLTIDTLVKVASPGLPELLGHGHRQQKPFVLLKPYVTNAASRDINPSLAPTTSDHGSSSTAPGNTPYLLSNYMSDAYYSSGHKAFLAALSSEKEPASYQEVLRDKVRRDSMGDEVIALNLNKTYLITTLPPKKSYWLEMGLPNQISFKWQDLSSQISFRSPW